VRPAPQRVMPAVRGGGETCLHPHC
jgi:hypothetical protein